MKQYRVIDTSTTSSYSYTGFPYVVIDAFNLGDVAGFTSREDAEKYCAELNRESCTL